MMRLCLQPVSQVFFAQSAVVGYGESVCFVSQPGADEKRFRIAREQNVFPPVVEYNLFLPLCESDGGDVGYA